MSKATEIKGKFEKAREALDRLLTIDNERELGPLDDLEEVKTIAEALKSAAEVEQRPGTVRVYVSEDDRWPDYSFVNEEDGNPVDLPPDIYMRFCAAKEQYETATKELRTYIPWAAQ